MVNEIEKFEQVVLLLLLSVLSLKHMFDVNVRENISGMGVLCLKNMFTLLFVCVIIVNGIIIRFDILELIEMKWRNNSIMFIQ